MLLLVLSTSITVGIIGSPAASPFCFTNIISITEISSPAYPENSTYFLTLNELLETILSHAPTDAKLRTICKLACMHALLKNKMANNDPH